MSSDEPPSKGREMGEDLKTAGSGSSSYRIRTHYLSPVLAIPVLGILAISPAIDM